MLQGLFSIIQSTENREQSTEYREQSTEYSAKPKIPFAMQFKIFLLQIN